VLNTTLHYRQYESDHSATDGHFAGHPIIPGVVILADVLRAIRAEINVGEGGYRLRAAKFLHPVRPGDDMAIEWKSALNTDSTVAAVHFECKVGATAVAKGTFEFDVRDV
jgi:3-hydroxymyristoyl/3-hydroxydecanoyl-(acyl carrier protein) dehydratase